MTSNNLSNLLVSMNSNVQLDTTAKTESYTLKQTAVSFEQTLQNYTTKNSVDVAGNTAAESITTDSTVTDNTSKPVTISEKRDIEADETKDNPIENLDPEEVQEKVEEFGDKVKDTIEEKLDVTEDEIEEAMEVLGLTVVDLIDPQNLAQLVNELTEGDNSVELLMSEDFKEILDDVIDFTADLLDELGIEPVDVKEFMITTEDAPQMNLQIDEDFTPQTDTQMDLTQDFESVATDETLTMDINTDTTAAAAETVEVVETVDTEATTETIDTTDATEAAETTVSAELTEQVTEVTETVETADTKTQTTKTSETSDTSDTTETSTEEIEEESDTARVTTEKSEDSDSSKEQSEDDAPQQKTNSPTIVSRFSHETQMPQAVEQFKLSFEPETETVSLPTGETVSTQEIVDQVIEQARVLTSEDMTTMEITMNPEGLGKVYVEVTQKGEEVTAKIYTENEAVKEALESQMANLRSGLNETTQKVTSIEVTVGSHQFEKNLEENARGQQQSEQQARDNTNAQMPRRSKINLNDLSSLQGLMTEEEQLVAQIMRDNGNTFDYHA